MCEVWGAHGAYVPGGVRGVRVPAAWGVCLTLIALGDTVDYGC